MSNNPMLIVESIKKTFDHTIAVKDLSFEVECGEVLSVIGANGAGKSTLTNILSGVIAPDHGGIKFNDIDIDMGKYSPHEAKNLGIRVVHQELSLCKNLTVYENFFIENGDNSQMKFSNWRSNAGKMAGKALEKIFPGNSINVNARLDTLSIAQMQMVEIARVFLAKDAKLILLDEPTSSLPNKETRQLLSYIKNSLNSGISYIYISHRLQEVQDISDRILIMQNGAKIYFSSIDDISISEMVDKMSTITTANGDNNISCGTSVINSDVSVKMNDYSQNGLKNITVDLRGGEIVGISGLEGNGQQELLQAIFFAKNTSSIFKSGKVAYVAGDRAKEGIFPLWSIKDNSGITYLADKPLLKPVRKKNINESIGIWNTRLKTKCVNYDDAIVSLSGGNQQKVLLTRALVADADIIILDDPSKGVDVETKQEFYQIFAEIAQSGKLIIWHSSDDNELEYCTKILALSEGKIVAAFTKDEFDHSKLMKITFGSLTKENKNHKIPAINKKSLPFLPALFAALALYIISGIISPSVFSVFGIELLAIGFTPFILGALAQTYIIGLGHIDLGIGSFMGLINVICATILYENTACGLFILLVLLFAYGCMGLLICWRKIPSIIVTLSMSFFWIGLAYVIQDVPGGTTPKWMISLFNFSNFIIPGVLVWLAVLIALSIFIYRTRLGTVLKGFGNNEKSMKNSGWSSYRAYFTTYILAGSFALLAGVCQSAITCASDVNAMSTYTILTVAAVIIGGGFFSGGYVSHVGTIFGGIVLTMVSVILGLFRVSTDFTATIQGFVLILILSLRLIHRESKND